MKRYYLCSSVSHQYWVFF